MAAPDLDVVTFADAAAWDAWLDEHHASSTGVWLKIPRGGGGIGYPEALEVALCHGWIDGQKRSLDASHWLQRFTPRTPRSRWSRVNRDKAVQLIERGAMKPAGLRQVELAKADGRWEAAYEGQRTIAVPEDLQRALDANPRAREFFAGLDRRNRYSILYRLQEATKPQTRARRLETFLTMLDEGRRIHE